MTLPLTDAERIEVVRELVAARAAWARLERRLKRLARTKEMS